MFSSTALSISTHLPIFISKPHTEEHRPLFILTWFSWAGKQNFPLHLCSCFQARCHVLLTSNWKVLFLSVSPHQMCFLDLWVILTAPFWNPSSYSHLAGSAAVWLGLYTCWLEWNKYCTSPVGNSSVYISQCCVYFSSNSSRLTPAGFRTTVALRSAEVLPKKVGFCVITV